MRISTQALAARGGKAVDSRDFTGRRGIRYLGLYKPTAPYALSGDRFLVPAGSGTFSLIPGEPPLNLNVSHFVATNECSDADLAAEFRDWLIFDTFILNDVWPIWYYDESQVGAMELVPDRVLPLPQTPDCRQIDYSNIAQITLKAGSAREDVPILSYVDLYNSYRGLCQETKEMLEWFASGPHRPHTRLGAFFSTRYWQLLHITILLERLIGVPEICPNAFGTCAQGHTPRIPHHSMGSAAWRRKFITERISDVEVAKDYTSLIETGFDVRNDFVHRASLDRSSYPELEPGETQTYNSDTAVAEYKDDSIALMSLLNSLNDITRYLLLDRAFNTRFFLRPLPMSAMRIVGKGAD